MKKLSYGSKIIAITIAILGICIGIAYALESYRLNVGQAITITEHAATGNYTNTCTSDIFIPTKTSAEWSAFRSGKPTCITAACFAADSSTAIAGGTNFTGYSASSRDAEATGLTCTTATYACSTAGAWSPSTPYKYCDDYGTHVINSLGLDTCNSDEDGQYTCGTNETKVCIDKFFIGPGDCMEWDPYYGECIDWRPDIYGKRNITCRGSDPAASCTAQSKIVNGHTYNTPLIAHGVTTPVNSATTVATTVTCAGNTYNYRQSFVCNYGVLSTSGTETTNTATCGTGYTPSGTTCVASTQSVACGGSVPANATAKAGHGTYTKTYVCGGTWSPASVSWTYNAATTCGYTCNSGYSWNGSSCVYSPVVNGACSTTSYTCTTGTVGDEYEYCDGTRIRLTWTCYGAGGGTNASCAKLGGICSDCEPQPCDFNTYWCSSSCACIPDYQECGI